jgi:hypothetical protein
MLLVGTTGERSQIGVPGEVRNAVDTPTRYVVLGFAGSPTYGVARSWFGEPSRFAEVRGNPV